MKFHNISVLFKAVNEGKVKTTDCISFNAQNQTFNSQGRAVRIVHDIGCFLAKGILKFITIKKLNNYVARHLDSAPVFWYNTGLNAFQNLNGKVTGGTLKQILKNVNNQKLLTDYTNQASLTPETTKFLSEHAPAKTTSDKNVKALSSDNVQSNTSIQSELPRLKRRSF